MNLSPPASEGVVFTAHDYDPLGSVFSVVIASTIARMPALTDSDSVGQASIRRRRSRSVTVLLVGLLVALTNAVLERLALSRFVS